MPFNSDFSGTTAVLNARDVAAGVLGAQNLGSAQAHHLVPATSINRNPNVGIMMQALENMGLYDHNGVENAVILPTTNQGSLATGAAKHLGNHLGSAELSNNAGREGYNRYVAEALADIESRWSQNAISSADAAKEILGLQNHLRSGLSSGYGIGSA